LVLNDADAFALAEAGHGAGRGFSRVFAIILGSGVGGGIVLDGQVIAGAGEWGHGPIVQNPAWPCGCGQTGCLDTVGSARGLERLGDGRATDIVRDWEQGGTVPAVQRWLDLVSGPLAMAINLLNADIVPVGGGLANAPRLIAALDHAVRDKILRQTGAPIVVCAQTSVGAGLLGAAMAGQRAFGTH
jgi:N-acetylglucosamine kinase